MNRSYSKQRHIQEANSKLEKQFLEEQGVFNKIKSAVKGVQAGLQARKENIFGSNFIRQNPKLQNLVAKLKTRSEFLEKELTNMKTEVSNYITELNDLKQKNPQYAATIDPAVTQSNTYLQSIENVIAQAAELQKFNVEYKAEQTTTQQQPVATQQPAATQQ